MPEPQPDAHSITVNGEEADTPVVLIQAGVEAVLSDAGVEEAEISVTLLDDEKIQSMNAEYLDRDRRSLGNNRYCQNCRHRRAMAGERTGMCPSLGGEGVRVFERGGGVALGFAGVRPTRGGA